MAVSTADEVIADYLRDKEPGCLAATDELTTQSQVPDKSSRSDRNHSHFEDRPTTFPQVNRTATYTKRLVTSRLLHRFNFGPTPGQYATLLKQGIAATQGTVLAQRLHDPALDSLVAPVLKDLGPYPQGSAAASTAFYEAMNEGNTELVTWWLDRMVLSRYPLAERMTWFWHGHWATSISKLGYPLPMQVQNNTLRTFALSNFNDMAKNMVLDGALNFWLDNEENYVSSPNENLAREFMELFTLGVNKFSQDDVTAAALALTGYQTVQSNGKVTFYPKQHYSKPLTVRGTTGPLNAETLASLIVSNHQTTDFITNRVWFRFVSSSTKAPAALATSFAGRDIASLVKALVHSAAFSDPAHALVKSPVEWFVGACRALRVRPSTLTSSSLQWCLSQMGQIPFNPPNVGGWPYDEAWLNGAALQYRFDLAQMIVAKGDLAPLGKSTTKMVQACADWLGVAEWSRRTASTLAAATANPSELAIAALCAPEYVVSA